MDVPEQRWRPLEEGSKGSFRGSAALLFELEDKVAQAAANVQSAQSEVIKVSLLVTGTADNNWFSPQVSYIEDRIAALNAAGIQGDRRRRVTIPYVSLFKERKAGFLPKVSDNDADNGSFVNTAAL